MKNTYLLLIACSLFLFSSCQLKKEVSYFQNIDQLTPAQIDSMSKPFSLKIMKDDMLSIIVNAIDPMAAAPFNLLAVGLMTPGQKELSYSQTLQYYLVDTDGCIQFPVLGKLYVAGMTKTQLTDFLTDKLSSYIKSPTVMIQFLSFKVSVMGEVNRPGSYTFANERVSILEALSTAGDLTIFGQRHNIIVIREVDGKKTFAKVNLSDSQLFMSPYFYLQQNDVVYVEPNTSKANSSRIGPSETIWISIVGTLVSVASLIVTIFTLAK